MDFMRFGQKPEASKVYSLQDIPVFSGLTFAEQKIIEKKARLVEYKRADIVYQEGTYSEAFYVVVSGRFRVFTEDRDSTVSETLFYLYRGDHFGEISLLTGQYHSASVEAKSDGLVLRLEKEDFLKFAKEMPSFSLYLSRSLGHRLTKSEETDGRSREVKIAALYPQSLTEDILFFGLDLSAHLVKESQRRVIVVDFVAAHEAIVKQEFKITNVPSMDFSVLDPLREGELRKYILEHPGMNKFYYLYAPAEQLLKEGDKKTSLLLTFLTYRFDYLLLCLTKDINPSIYQALKQSDMVYIYCSPEAKDLVKCAETVAEFQHGFGFSKSEIKVIVPEGKGQLDMSYEDREKILGARIFSLLPSRLERTERYQSMMRYLSRELAEMLVGLVLGSGAAYGLSHIGVLRVFERENIPIDIVAGASIGALVGAYWTSGFSSEELEKVAYSITPRNAFFKLVGFRDLFFTNQGVLKGDQIVRFMENYFGHMTFQDLKIPLKIVACNLHSSEEIIFEAGSLIDALRASISIPGILRPHLYRGEYLIDGGVIDPLPVRVLNQMGVKRIIAVNVLPNAHDRISSSQLKLDEKYKRVRTISNKKTGLKKMIRSLYPQRDYMVNTFNVIMNTILFMECELAESSGREADVLIHPDVSEGHWAQFYAPAKFIKAGEKAALQHLNEIKQLLSE